MWCQGGKGWQEEPPEKVQFTQITPICSVTEVSSKGKAVRAVPMLLDAKMKVLCRKIRARYVDLSAELVSPKCMGIDGIHHYDKGARLVSHRIAEVALTFCLEKKSRKSCWWNWKKTAESSERL